MNICIFSAQYAPSVGGVERFTEAVAAELVKKGVGVTIVTSNGASLEADTTENGIRVLRLPCYNLLNGRYPVPKKNAEYKRLFKTLEKESFDLVMINTRFYLLSVAGASFARKHNIPCITQEHGSAHLSVGNKILDLFGQVFEHFITLFMKRNCKRYYGISDVACRWLEHFGIKAEGCLYNFISTENIDALSEKAGTDYRAELGIAGDTVIVAFAGRLVPEKGVLAIAEAVERLSGEGENICAVLAGEGYMEDKLKKHGNVYLTGKLPFSKVVALYSCSQVFCLPSVSEGLCTSFLEAVYCGCFSVCTPVGGVNEILLDGVSGIELADCSTAAVYEGLKRYLALTPVERSGIQNKALEIMREKNWSAASTAEKIINIME